MPRKSTAKLASVQKPQCHIHDSVESWEVDSIREKVCLNDKSLIEFKGNHYCFFHLPTNEKDSFIFEQHIQTILKEVENNLSDLGQISTEIQNIFKSKISYDFRYVWFPEANFGGYKFLTVAKFNYATFANAAFFTSAIFSDSADFSNVTFKEATFDSTTFSAEVNFNSAHFKGYTSFNSAIFLNKTSFYQALFLIKAYFESVIISASFFFNEVSFENGVDFGQSTFDEKSEVFFNQTKFSEEVNFQYTIFKGYVAFEGKQDNRLFIGENVFLNLQNARIEDAEKISFHTIRLEPSWFINTDASKFIFTDCKLEYADGKRLNVEIELSNLRERGFKDNPYKLLTKACWQLAANHEEMKSFPKASLFRQIAQESKRLGDYNGWKVWSLHWWYWLSSFYGESPLRAGLVLALIILLFAIAFMFTDFQSCLIDETGAKTVCKPHLLNIWESFLQSLATATFQNIEYIKANSKITTFLIIFEKILAPLQAALLALAIRRKFMR